MPREAMPTPNPEPERERRVSDPPMRISAGGVEVVAKGAQAVYALGLVVCFYLGGRVLPPALEAVQDLTKAMHDSATALAKVSADVAEARAAAGRVEQAQAQLDHRLGAIEADIAALRADLRDGKPARGVLGSRP